MTRRPAAGERTVNGIRTLVVRALSEGPDDGPCRAASGKVALDGDDAGRLTGTHDVADEGLALPELLVPRLGELLDDLHRAGPSRSRRRARSSMSAGSTGPCVHSRAAPPVEEPAEVPVGPLGRSLETLLRQPAAGADPETGGDGIRLDRAHAPLRGRADEAADAEAASTGPSSAAGGARPGQRALRSLPATCRGDRVGVAHEDERPGVEAVGLLEADEGELVAVAGVVEACVRSARRARRPRRSR